QRARREHHPVADIAGHALAENSGGNEVQHRLLPADDEGMPGVVPALKAHHALGMVGEPVHDLALALVAPLGADHYDVLAHLLALPHDPFATALGELAVALRSRRVGGVPGKAHHDDLSAVAQLAYRRREGGIARLRRAYRQGAVHLRGRS